MKAVIESVQLQRDQQTYHIKGKLKGRWQKDRLMIFFEERVSKLDYFVPKRIYTTPEWQGMSFFIPANINEWQHLLIEKQPWDLYVSDQYQFKKAEVGENCGLDDKSLKLPYLFYNIKPFMTDSGFFAMSVKPKKFSFYISEATVEKGDMSVSIEVPDNFFQKVSKPSHHTHKTSFVLKKKLHPDIGCYYEAEKSYPVAVDGDYITGTLPFPNLAEEKYEATKTVWDAFLSVTDETANITKEYRVKIKDEGMPADQWVSISRYLYASIQGQASGRLSVLFQIEKPVVLDQIKMEGGNAILQGESDAVIDELTLRKRSSFQGAPLTAEIKSCRFTQKDGGFTAILPLNQLVNGYRVADGDQFFMNAGIRLDDMVLHAPVGMAKSADLPEMAHRVNNHFQFLFTNDTSDEFTLVGKEKTAEPSNYSLNIAVNGSCFSRMGFGSSDYFQNQDYKDRYEVVNTQWHSSIISTMSKPVKFPSRKFKGIHPTLVERVQSDLQKNFFKKLKKAKPDFLVMDFYADGCRDVLVFDSKHAITANYVLRQSWNYMYGVDSDVTVLNQENIDLLLRYWKPAIRAFCKKIVRYIPEERIILQKVRKTEAYYTKDGKTKRFANKDYIRRSNYLFEYMENEFLALMPNVQIIDLTYQGFQSDIHHPSKTTSNHYESGYYKEYMDQINECVLNYLLAHPDYLKKRKRQLKG